MHVSAQIALFGVICTRPVFQALWYIAPRGLESQGIMQHRTNPLSVTNQCRMSNIYWAECFGPCGTAHVLQAMDRGFVAHAMYSPGIRSHRGNKRRAEPTKQFIPFWAFWLRYQFNIWYGPCARFDIKFIYCGGEIATVACHRSSHVSLGCCIIALVRRTPTKTIL